MTKRLHREMSNKKKKVFRREQEMLRLSSFQTSVAPETRHAWSPKPKVERRQRGATSWKRETDRRLERVVAHVRVKVQRYCGDVPCSERNTSTATLKRMRSGTCSQWSVEADQDIGDMGSPAKIEDHTSSSILDRLQARIEDIRESEQDAVAVVEPRKD
jgi:hypothetical protein